MSEPTAQATVASARAYGLAEGPLWDAPRNRVIWVDINAGRVLAGALRDRSIADVAVLVDVEETVGAAVGDAGGRLLVAGARSVFTADEPGSRTTLFDVAKNSRLNDGACDPAGRFLVGSMALDDRRGEECLYRLEHDGTVTTLDHDLTVSNGLAWSPDGRVLYSVDTAPGIVYARAYDHTPGPRRVLLELDAPDGLTVDADGNLWIALHGAGEVRCYTPRGRLLHTIAVENPYTTSVAFAGPGLDTLVITTASDDERTPAGHLYIARPGVRGLPATVWAAP